MPEKRCKKGLRVSKRCERCYFRAVALGRVEEFLKEERARFDAVMESSEKVLARMSKGGV